MSGNNEGNGSNGGRRNIVIPRPTSQIQCAAIVGYVYIDTNIISDELLLVQRNYVNSLPTVVNGVPQQCGCQAINGNKCHRKACPNYSAFVFCPSTCGPQCLNNPLAHGGYAAGKKTYLKYDEMMGFGIFAFVVIERFEWIGEYTGVVISDDEIDELTDIQLKYLFNYDIIDQSIDPVEKGSCLKCINHDCNPNCEAMVMANQGRLSIMFRAKRKIKPDEELTIDYNWRYETIEKAQLCYCKSQKRKHYIGSKIPTPSVKKASMKSPIVPASPESHSGPIAFSSMVRNPSAQVQRLLASPPEPNERPDDYLENHLHQPLDYIFGIAHENGQLRIFGGRFVECYQNRHGIWIYVIRRMYPGIVDYHLPRFLTFQHQEDAHFALQELYSNNDLNAIRRYTAPIPTRRSGRDLQNEVAEDYVQEWRNLDLPNTIMTPVDISGQPAIGHAANVLERVSQKSKLRNESKSDSDESLFVPCTPKKKVTQKKEVKKASAQTSKKSSIADKFFKAIAKQPTEPLALQPADSGPETNPSSSSSSDSDDIGSSVVEPRRSGYHAMTRRNLADVISENYNDVLLRRQFDNAVEQITLSAISRQPANSNLSFSQINQIIRQDLEPLYFTCRPKNRKYLLYSHYLIACENLSSRSISLNWCPMCRKPHTFTDPKAMNRHYHSTHAVCARLYNCPSCNLPFHLPSVLRDHVETCDPSFTESLRTDILPFILDAYADFVALRDQAGHPLHLIIPGLPLMRNFENPQASHSRGMHEIAGPRIEIDRNTGTPTDPTVDQGQDTHFNMQKTYTTISGWDALYFPQSIDPQGRPPLGLPQAVSDRRRAPPRAAKVAPKIPKALPGPSQSKKRSRTDVRNEELKSQPRSTRSKNKKTEQKKCSTQPPPLVEQESMDESENASNNESDDGSIFEEYDVESESDEDFEPYPSKKRGKRN